MRSPLVSFHKTLLWLMQAVQILLVLRERLHSEESQGVANKVDDSAVGELVEVDPIQVSFG